MQKVRATRNRRLKWREKQICQRLFRITNPPYTAGRMIHPGKNNQRDLSEKNGPIPVSKRLRIALHWLHLFSKNNSWRYWAAVKGSLGPQFFEVPADENLL